MKIPYKNSLVILLSIFFLSSCFTSPEEVNNAKKNMGIIQEDTKLEKEIIVNKKEENISQKDAIKENTDSNIKIEYLTDDRFLELNSLNYKDFINGKAEISGITLEKIEKIDVNFSNTSSDFPDDLFVLKQFKSGNKTFVYRAYTTYKVLDFGVNEYIFTAYSGKKISKLKLTVNVKKENEIKEFNPDLESKKIEEISYNKIKVDNNDIILILPTGPAFGHPISLGENLFTYSDISGLEINTYSFSGIIKCDNITEFLTKKIGTWFYWNTCRNIIHTKENEKSKGISFYVIRLDGENYYYEKHFLDFEKGLYGNYEIEKGIDVDEKNISEKNSELKKVNDNIINIDIVTNLFKKIIQY